MRISGANESILTRGVVRGVNEVRGINEGPGVILCRGSCGELCGVIVVPIPKLRRGSCSRVDPAFTDPPVFTDPPAFTDPPCCFVRMNTW